jgi:hypothetical protein
MAKTAGGGKDMFPTTALISKLDAVRLTQTWALAAPQSASVRPLPP